MEHLLPHENGKYHDRKIDWNNLFWSCGHCNGVKNQKKYKEGIMDCCITDPEEYIYFRISGKEVVVTAQNNDETAVRTAELVKEVFSLENTGMRTYKSDMRFKCLVSEMNVLYDNLEKISRIKSDVAKIKGIVEKRVSICSI